MSDEREALAQLIWNTDDTEWLDTEKIESCRVLADAILAAGYARGDSAARECIRHANNSIYGSDAFFIYNDDPRDLSDKIEDMKARCNALWRENETLKAGDSTAMREALEECASALDEMVQAAYPPESRAYPSEERRYQRDVGPVLRARAALALPAPEPVAAPVTRCPCCHAPAIETLTEDELFLSYEHSREPVAGPVVTEAMVDVAIEAIAIAERDEDAIDTDDDEWNRRVMRAVLEAALREAGR